eukprot:10804137-Karenia_brevis.AAC.1
MCIRDRHKSGHCLYGSGGCKGKAGVGILVNERYNGDTKAVPLSNRLMYLDVRLPGIKFRLVNVYMPHSGYKDNAVAEIYDAIEHIREEA